MAEYEICSNLIRLYIGYKDKFNIDIYRDILEFENKNDFKFSEDQIEALVGGIKKWCAYNNGWTWYRENNYNKIYFKHTS